MVSKWREQFRNPRTNFLVRTRVQFLSYYYGQRECDSWNWQSKMQCLHQTSSWNAGTVCVGNVTEIPAFVSGFDRSKIQVGECLVFERRKRCRVDRLEPPLIRNIPITAFSQTLKESIGFQGNAKMVFWFNSNWRWRMDCYRGRYGDVGRYVVWHFTGIVPSVGYC